MLTGAWKPHVTPDQRLQVFLEPGFSVDAFLQDCRRRVAMTELQNDLGPSCNIVAWTLLSTSAACNMFTCVLQCYYA